MTTFRVFELQDVDGDRFGAYREVRPEDITDDVVERAANEIWPLENLSSDDARDELRRDTRRALVAALTASQSPTEADNG